MFLNSTPIVRFLIGSGVSACWLLCSPDAAAQRPLTIVSVGDSVASGQGNPDIPAVVSVNPDFNPVEFLPNLEFDPIPSIPNPDFDPIPGYINVDYNPVPLIINPNYQPFPIPAILAPLLPNFPPYDPNLTISNPAHDPNLTISNPDFDPLPLIPNPDLDLRLFTDTPNPAYDPDPVREETPAQWASPNDWRSNLAGPALAAADLIALHPERDIQFLHLAKSGDDVEDVIGQVETALAMAGGRIDVLMISVGGNNIGGGGFSGLFDSVLNSATSGMLPSQNASFNQEITDSFENMPGLFADLADHIKDCEIGEVFITEYFDMTRGVDGEFSLDLGNNEMQWVYESIIVPLNAIIEEAAVTHGWHYVGGIASQFRTHGYFAGSFSDLSPLIPNPDYDPRETIVNLDYNPFQTLPNLGYNPVANLPNFNYNPIQNKPNIHYDPRRNIANPNFKPLPPNQDLRLTIPNPGFDTRLTVPNPAYDPALTVPNPAYDPALTVPNLAYDPELRVENPGHDPALTIPNPAFEEGVAEGENWVVRVEESQLIQSDINGTAHPNRQGQQVYRNRLREEILAFGLENILLCPKITRLAMDGSSLHFEITSEYPVESLEIQSFTALPGAGWEDESADITDLGDHLMEARIEMGSEPRKFFRVTVPE